MVVAESNQLFLGHLGDLDPANQLLKVNLRELVVLLSARVLCLASSIKGKLDGRFLLQLSVQLLV